METTRQHDPTSLRFNCGRNLSPDLIAKATLFIKEFQPKNEVERRDKKILVFAIVCNMNSAAIARLKDPDLVSYAPNSKGMPLSGRSIDRIVKQYLPYVRIKNRPDDTRAKPLMKQSDIRELRNDMFKNHVAYRKEKPKCCSACASTKNLELHHIIPLSVGGTNDYFNLVYLCHDCHMKLHHTLYDKYFKKGANHAE